MNYLPNILFAIALVIGIGYFVRNVQKLIRNINLGKSDQIFPNKKERWKRVFFIALGQSKMFKKPLVALLHLIVYIGFVVINIEVVEIIIDGLFGTHRILSFLGPFYNFLIATFEILALLVLIACIIFLIRRNILFII